MRPLAILAFCLLAACGLPEGGAMRPEAVTLGGERLSVTFPAGVICHATVPLTGGEGGFAPPCPQPARWAVSIVKRNYLEPLFGAAVSPYARIVISDAAGRSWSFRTPPVPEHNR